MAGKPRKVTADVETSKSKKTKSFLDTIRAFDNSAEVLSEAQSAVIKDYIDTGNYMLNACMTGSIRRGVPCGKIVTLAGSSGCGKSFLALSICRNAQKKGYAVIYYDSEGAIDIETVRRIGCDTENFILKQVNTITEVSTHIANLCKQQLSLPEEERQKIILVLDSLGNLTSEKELSDTLDGSGKRDMTKQQEIKAMFRVNATNLMKLGIPFIVNTHVYQSMDLFSKQVLSGGCLVPDEKIITSDGVKRIEDIVKGDKVLTHMGEYREVIETFRYEKPTILFKFDNGNCIECSREHRFLVETDVWREAKDLELNDNIKTSTGTITVVDIINNDEEKSVCDLCVDGHHSYVSENGIINHNSGIVYSASLTILLSAAKLDDKESDKAAEKRVGEFTKTGIIVTAKPEKTRFTIPQKVQFQIPFFKAPNPYIGLERYLTWENSGIMRGSIISETEYNKLLDSEKMYCGKFTDASGKTVYAKPKDTSRSIVVRHLGKALPMTDLFTKEVFTDEILDYLDEHIIRPSFELPSQDAMNDIDEILDMDANA